MTAAKNSHRVISTTTVVATEAPPLLSKRIELTPCDLQLLFVNQIQKGLLFRKPEQDHNRSYTVEHLKESLSRALSIFYPLAGRLASDDNGDGTTSFFLDCNNAGAAFVHAVAGGVSVDDVTGPAVVPDDIIYPFFAMNGTLSCDGVSEPLLAVQITELADGLFVACSINHSVFDGTSFWRFFNTWARISRDPQAAADDACPPIFGHNYLEGVVDLPIRLPGSIIPVVTTMERNLPTNLQQRMFLFSREKVAELKAKANVEMGTDKISSLQALLAHLWVSVTRHRKVAPEEELGYIVLVGLRPRLDPPLSDRHVGNMVVMDKVKRSAGELLGAGGAGSAAWEMNRMIASNSIGGVMSFFRGWVQSPVFSTMGELPRNYLATGSSPRFDVYGNDFGWGRPVAVRSGPGNKFDGKLTVFAGAEEGSVQFETCLLRETLEAMAKDEEFMQSLSNQ